MNNSNSFKVRVKEIIGRYGEVTFGAIGTEHIVTDGILIDLDGSDWGIYKKINSLEDANNVVTNESFGNIFKVVFELVED